MENILYVGFKGKNNSSNNVVSQIDGETFYLTNSFKGLRSDIDRITKSYDLIFMFGLDKSLHEEIRIEKVAKNDEIQLQTTMNINYYADLAKANGITCKVSDKPTAYLCNDAYFYMLMKMKCPVLFIHIPTSKNMSSILLEKLISIFER
ncbi:MAG: hypothetical protein ACI4ES_12535 [Roseburia sp.]